MPLIQVILTLFFLYAIGKVLARFRQGEVTKQFMLFWSAFWLVAIMIVLFPVPVTSSVAKLLGVGRGADLVVYVSLALLFFMLFKLMVRVEKQQREITVLVRKIALNDPIMENDKVRMTNVKSMSNS